MTIAAMIHFLANSDTPAAAAGVEESEVVPGGCSLLCVASKSSEVTCE